MRPIFKAGIESLFNQQGTHARAVNEEVTFDGFTALHGDALNVAILTSQGDVLDFAFGANGASFLGKCAQEFGIQAGIKVKRISDVGQG